jgi:hypothetical protein
MSALSFLTLCGNCFRNTSQQKEGSVLSCGDFMCLSCSKLVVNTNTCPACGKENVKLALLNDSLPDEVMKNMGDTSKDIESIHDVLVFQVKYYKLMIKRLLFKLQQSNEESRKISKYYKPLNMTK